MVRRRRPNSSSDGRRPAAPRSGRRLELVALLGGALAIKSIVLVQLGGHPLLQPHGDLDTTYYVGIAHQIAAAGPLAIREPFFVSPLYVYFLAAVFRIGGSLTAARIAQILLGTAAVGLVYATARRWFDARVAGVAAILTLATGLFTFNEILILQSALDPFLVAAALYFVSRAQTTPGRGALVWAGIALGLLALNRPNALAYGVAAAVLVGFASTSGSSPCGRQPASSSPLGRAAILAAGLVAVLGMNASRNYLASGNPVLISSHGGLNFYIGNNAEATGIYHPVPGVAASIAGQVRDATRVAEAAEGRPLSSSEVSSHFYRAAWAWIGGHPGNALRLFARKLALLVNRVDVPLNYSYAFYSRDESSALRLLVAGPWLLLPLGLVGLLLAARDPALAEETSPGPSRLGYWTWASFVPIYALSVAAFFVSDRYRMPLLVPLSILGAYTLIRVFDYLRARQLAALAIALAALALVATVVAWDFGLDDGLGGERARKAVWLIERGSYDEARTYVAGAAVGLPHTGVFHYRVGEAFTAARRYRDAIAELRAALAVDSEQPAIDLALGQALVLSGNPREGVQHLQRALERAFRPEVSGPWLVRALAGAGRHAEAITVLATLSDAVVGASGAATALDMGSLALQLEAPASSERWLRAAVTEAPDSAEGQEKLALALVLQRRPGEALEPIEQACRLAPASASARLNLAVVYAQLGRVDEAASAAREAVRLDPSEPRAAALLKALGSLRQ